MGAGASNAAVAAGAGALNLAAAGCEENNDAAADGAGVCAGSSGSAAVAGCANAAAAAGGDASSEAAAPPGPPAALGCANREAAGGAMGFASLLVATPVLGTEPKKEPASLPPRPSPVGAELAKSEAADGSSAIGLASDTPAWKIVCGTRI